MLIMEDIDAQPAALGAGPDRSRSRDRRLNACVAERSLVTLNLAVGVGTPHKVNLPLRQKDIHILPGHTHHCASQPRALDIMVATTEVANGEGGHDA